MSFRMGIGLLGGLCLAASCGSRDNNDTGRASSGTMSLSGYVLRDSGSGKPTALEKVEVRASVDRNGDGVIAADEAVAVQSGTDGAYALVVNVKTGDPVVLRFTSSGLATVYRTVKGAPQGNMVVSATLKELETLQCTGASCTARSGLAMTGLPDGTTGSARVFNPVSESAAFPGDFNDSSGNLLQSGVFASFDLKDKAGNPVDKLAKAATLKMRMPRDTWPLVKDISPGTDRIEVPLYTFDEAKGTWVREGQGHLEDADGNVIGEGSLASIKGGTWDKAVFVAGDVAHFSSWNCDWPVESHGRLGGTLGECWWNGERKPCAGATVSVSGATYTGTSTPVTVGSDGSFRVDVMRSEAPGEDLDGDGVTGEETKVTVRVVWEGRVYDLGTCTLPPTQATGDGDTKDLGSMKLDDSKLLHSSICAVTGTVSFSDGSPAAGAQVMGYDDQMPSGVFESLCSSNPSCFMFIGTADTAGKFSVSVPMMSGLDLWSSGTRNPGNDARVTETAYGQRAYASCPSAPVSLTLDQGWIQVTATASWDGSAISWAPAYGASFISVSSADGSSAKWAVVAATGVMKPPLAYGTLPAGATQILPFNNGQPGAVNSGDIIQITLSDTSSSGTSIWGSATFTVP